MKTCVIYLVRHGESTANRDKLITGHWDVPLTELGRQQAAETRELLKAVHFDAVYSSDLERAVQTGTIIHGQPIPPERQLFDLREVSYGKFQGQPKKLIALSGLDAESSGEVESLPAMTERFMRALKLIAESHMGETVLVAAHSGPIRAILVELGFAPREDLPHDSFKNSGYVELVYDGRGFKVKKVVGIKKPAEMS